MSDSEGVKHGSEAKIHHSTSETRERMVDRMRRTGIPKDVATKIAESGVREAHTKLDRR